jgi:hypothetical protein
MIADIRQTMAVTVYSIIDSKLKYLILKVSKKIFNLQNQKIPIIIELGFFDFVPYNYLIVYPFLVHHDTRLFRHPELASESAPDLLGC